MATFSHDYDEVIQKIPLERILVETDCPYVAPASHRGKRNEPAFIKETYHTLATLRGMDDMHFAESVRKNAERIFNILL